MKFDHLPMEKLITKGGNPAKNQYVYTEPNGSTIFVSYNSVIAYKCNDPTRLDVDTGKLMLALGYELPIIVLDSDFWEWSVTTSEYRRQFLGEGIDDTRLKIATGQYVLASLN